MTNSRTLNGMRALLLITFGQLVSLTGSGMTGFALGVWVYERTGSATQFALISFFATLPGILISPVAGALVDRYDRRRMMILSDSGVGLCTLVTALLLLSGRLEIWHIYIAVGVGSIFAAFQWPAYSAAVTVLVPKEQLGRASGMMQSAQAAAQIVAPMLAGVLIGVWRVEGILLVDFATFVFALITLFAVSIPAVPRSGEAELGRGSLFREAVYGWKYITARAGLLGLLIFFAVTNFLTSVAVVLFAPLVLSFTSAGALGLVLTVAGVGMLAGGIVMSAWGGPRRRIYGVLGFTVVEALVLMTAALRPSVVLIASASFVFFFANAIILSSGQAIWQSKVSPSVQGRVFAVRRMVAWSTTPLAYLVAGPLADRVFEPLLASDGPLAATAGRIIGTGPGRGIALMFILSGFALLLVTISYYLHPRVRMVEAELPDALAENGESEIEAGGKAAAGQG